MNKKTFLALAKDIYQPKIYMDAPVVGHTWIIRIWSLKYFQTNGWQTCSAMIDCARSRSKAIEKRNMYEDWLKEITPCDKT